MKRMQVFTTLHLMGITATHKAVLANNFAAHLSSGKIKAAT